MRQLEGQFDLLPLPTQAQITVFENLVIPTSAIPLSFRLKKVEFECQVVRKKILIITWPPCYRWVLRWMTSVDCDAVCVFFFSSKLLTHTVKHYRVAREMRHLNFISTHFNSMSGLLLPAQ